MATKAKKQAPVQLKDIMSGKYWFTAKELVQNIDDAYLESEAQHSLANQNNTEIDSTSILNDDRYHPNLEMTYNSYLTTHLNFNKQHDHVAGVSEWPSSSPYACFNCQEMFNGPPVRLPKSFDEKNVIFKGMTGNWCSVACLRRYIMDRHDYNYKQQLLLISAMCIHLYHIEPRHTAPAPPVECLKKFGGPMSIEEYRQEHVKSNIIPTAAQHVPGAVMYEIMRYNHDHDTSHVTCDHRPNPNADWYQVPSMGFSKLPEFQVPIKDTPGYQHAISSHQQELYDE